MKIRKITAREILDSRGNPTVEATVELTNKVIAKASVPSGASTGIHEALELRDGDKKRYLGRGVLKAVNNIEKKIAPALKGMTITNQAKIDSTMIKLDGTDNKRKLGANAILAVSLACARAGSLAKKKPLYRYIRETFKLKEKGWRMPIPTMNILNGGKHADNSLTIQEFMVVPKASTIARSIQIGAEVFHHLKTLLKQAGFHTLVGDEGGFAPNLRSNEQALQFIVEAIKKAGYKPGKDAFLAMDLALSEYFDPKTKEYSLNDKKGKKFISADEVIKILEQWLNKYPIISIEDPLHEDDWINWNKLTNYLGQQVTLVGDDLFVTNSSRLYHGIENYVANAILIKLNQIGSLSETIETIYLAKANNYKVSVSHRSGETCDTFIADLAVAVNSDFIKTGSLSRSERVSKYNRLMEIERELNK
ncbi:phosphopyruvate hydratase [Candidatus Falkowbacteria bacterium RIFOXYD2_FULL_35_9]|uniref:Enolase n=1 Tax=Candidatus Falkowbacteria bacterium RIFOXYC2_FULL_36_12 TaxID=1798002 RepID=A0A1F5SYE0_9BACT|nr:MAG: phosphopyruvate hydratase [Candidatus Falkowbacteria bacterium RIFOXYC2_FULL_36_12]OGF32000.1 MAG: phosphopyruvate hydratase [Candidatus Falkowbacteria bacterium RIFOXYB2_FULL_35_7]OGF34045.1 MAG: phosphopyruvate hydratase [Candidatus Falkowbacteria bacterium RIFOXYA2_FULL_35_8]OGF45939.1 MAG: phosphopyruvate hydratase [Candidatus Falkowbacteria bacterium RIFOXYD2_FULL_35_9]